MSPVSELAVSALRNALAASPNVDPAFTAAVSSESAEIRDLKDKLAAIRATARDLLFAIDEEKAGDIRSAAADLAPLVGYAPDTFDRNDI
jgi:hypothetical protein